MFLFCFVFFCEILHAMFARRPSGGEESPHPGPIITSAPAHQAPRKTVHHCEKLAQTREERETTTSRSAEEVYPPLITIIEMIEGVSGNSREHVWPCNGVIEVFFFLFLLLQIERTTDTSRPKERGDGPVMKKKRRLEGNNRHW